MWRSTMWVLSYYWSLSVVSRTFSVLCVYSTFGHHPHPLGYLCSKFCFFRSLHCWASQRRKIAYQSLTPSKTQLIWCPGNRSFRFGKIFLNAFTADPIRALHFAILVQPTFLIFDIQAPECQILTIVWRWTLQTATIWNSWQWRG